MEPLGRFLLILRDLFQREPPVHEEDREQSEYLGNSKLKMGGHLCIGVTCWPAFAHQPHSHFPKTNIQVASPWASPRGGLGSAGLQGATEGAELHLRPWASGRMSQGVPRSHAMSRSCPQLLCEGWPFINFSRSFGLSYQLTLGNNYDLESFIRQRRLCLSQMKSTCFKYEKQQRFRTFISMNKQLTSVRTLTYL